MATSSQVATVVLIVLILLLMKPRGLKPNISARRKKAAPLSFFHIHLYLVYKKLKYFTTKTWSNKNKTNSWNKYTSHHLTLHTYMGNAVHHTASPMSYSRSITRRLPCNCQNQNQIKYRCNFYQLHFNILARQDHRTWFNHSLLCQPKTAWQSACSTAARHGGSRSRRHRSHDRNAFRKGAIRGVSDRRSPALSNTVKQHL